MKKNILIITLTLLSANQCFGYCYKDSDCKEEGEYCAIIGGGCPGQTPYGNCLPKKCSSVADCTKDKNTLPGFIKCEDGTCHWNTTMLGTYILCPHKSSLSSYKPPVQELDPNELARIIQIKEKIGEKE